MNNLEDFLSFGAAISYEFPSTQKLNITQILISVKQVFIFEHHFK